MKIKEFARWLSLIEGINKVDKFCQLKKIDFDKIQIKPGYLQQYIDERSQELYLNYHHGLQFDIVNRLIKKP
jgi:hypothetical protein